MLLQQACQVVFLLGCRRDSHPPHRLVVRQGSLRVSRLVGQQANQAAARVGRQLLNPLGCPLANRRLRLLEDRQLHLQVAQLANHQASRLQIQALGLLACPLALHLVPLQADRVAHQPALLLRFLLGSRRDCHQVCHLHVRPDSHQGYPAVCLHSAPLGHRQLFLQFHRPLYLQGSPVVPLLVNLLNSPAVAHLPYRLAAPAANRPVYQLVLQVARQLVHRQVNRVAVQPADQLLNQPATPPQFFNKKSVWSLARRLMEWTWSLSTRYFETRTKTRWQWS